MIFVQVTNYAMTFLIEITFLKLKKNGFRLFKDVSITIKNAIFKQDASIIYKEHRYIYTLLQINR